MAINIKRLREKTGLTQTDFGERLGLTKQAISNYENGRVPSEAITNLVLICCIKVESILGLVIDSQLSIRLTS